MVRAIPSNPSWSIADFLERIRPGFALSAALHIGLLMALAYFLAFHPALQLPAAPPIETITMVQLPPQPPAKPQTTPMFKPTLAPPIDEVRTTVGTLPLPPHETFDRSPATTVTMDQPPAQEVIIDPKPVYRGGLVYPDRAVEAGANGYVDFSFIIEPDGSVGNPQVIAEVPDGYGFAAAAKKAFPKWRFEPKLVNGQAVAVPAQIRVTFKLQ